MGVRARATPVRCMPRGAAAPPRFGRFEGSEGTRDQLDVSKHSRWTQNTGALPSLTKQSLRLSTAANRSKKVDMWFLAGELLEGTKWLEFTGTVPPRSCSYSCQRVSGVRVPSEPNGQNQARRTRPMYLDPPKYSRNGTWPHKNRYD